jgi:hypothetical protein
VRNNRHDDAVGVLPIRLNLVETALWDAGGQKRFDDPVMDARAQLRRLKNNRAAGSKRRSPET